MQAGQTGARSCPTAVQAGYEYEDAMKIRLRAGKASITATLVDSGTSRDFVSLLPLKMTLNDLFRREKFGHLPRAISDDGRRTHTHKLGEIAYWSPGPDVAVFYRHDGQKIPDPGIIVIAEVDSGVEAFNVDGSLEVAIELVTESQPPGH